MFFKRHDRRRITLKEVAIYLLASLLVVRDIVLAVKSLL
jgi:hypothetical protein